jgi:hypothetical protein
MLPQALIYLAAAGLDATTEFFDIGLAGLVESIAARPWLSALWLSAADAQTDADIPKTAPAMIQCFICGHLARL